MFPQEFYTTVSQIFVHFGIMYHFAKQIHLLRPVFFESFIGNLYGILNPVTKTKMAGNKKSYRPDIKHRRTVILLPGISYFPGFLYNRNYRTAVIYRYIKLLHLIFITL